MIQTIVEIKDAPGHPNHSYQVWTWHRLAAARIVTIPHYPLRDGIIARFATRGEAGAFIWKMRRAGATVYRSERRVMGEDE